MWRLYCITTTYGSIETWDVWRVTKMYGAFSSDPTGNIPGVLFNADLSSWTVSNVTGMGSMFSLCNVFNSDLSSWTVSNVNDMGSMFHFCRVFNSDLSSWDVNNVTDMKQMFYECSVFNSDLSNWTVSNVADMDSMFENCSVFNSDLSSWTFDIPPDHKDWCTGAPICADPVKYPQF